MHQSCQKPEIINLSLAVSLSFLETSAGFEFVNEVLGIICIREFDSHQSFSQASSL